MDVKYFYLDNFLLTCTRSSSQLTCHCLLSVLRMCEFQHIASSLILYLIDFNFLQSIHDQEDEVELLKSKCEKAREDFANAKLELREQLNEGLGKCSCQSLTTDMQEILQKNYIDFNAVFIYLTEAAEDLPGIQIMMKELDDVLLRDVGNKINDSGK